MTTGVVTFDYSAWSAMYPVIAASVNQQSAQMYFNQAQLYCDNTVCSPVTDASVGGQREMFLYMLTAHIALLNAPINGQPPNPLVGRISNATEGSVSVQTQMDYPPGSPQWYMQTQPGASYWAASAGYRVMQYVPGPCRQFDQIPEQWPWQ